MLNRDRLWTHLGIAFAAALGLYVLGFAWMEHRRTRRGPWQVTFVNEDRAAPRIVINQPALQITNAQIEFTATANVPPTNASVEFVPGREVPFPVPFGECIFMDPLFLPGTVTLDLFDHQIELLPRTLSVDGHEYPWASGMHLDADVRR